MRAKILEYLKQQRQPVSGEELSLKLNVSRTAVWKHIKVLQDLGYHIDSIPRKGYLLQGVPDRLLSEEIKPLLNTESLGRRMEYFASINSTNQKIKELAKEGVEAGLVVVADEQTEGRGRLGRYWHSSSQEGLGFSVLLRPNINAMEASKMTLVAGVSVAQAIKQNLHINVGIKWPNDIVWEGKKLAGILTELSGELEAVHYLIIGIGINANQVNFPQEVQDKACSLYQILGKPIERPNLLAAVLNQLEANYQQFLRGEFAKLLAEWKKLCVHLGQWVKVITPQGEQTLKVLDVDLSGGLICIDAADNQILLQAGEISLRSVADTYI